MREWIDRLSEAGAMGMGAAALTLSHLEPWTMSVDDFGDVGLRNFNLIIERLATREDNEIGGVDQARILYHLAYAPVQMRLGALMFLADTWPAGLDRVLSRVPADIEARVYRHNIMSSMMLFVRNTVSSSIFSPVRMHRVMAAAERAEEKKN